MTSSFRTTAGFRRAVQLFTTFLKVSAVGVGGGLSMIPVIRRELVEKRRVLSDAEMVDAIAVVQSLPGIIGTNLAAVLGYRIGRLPGAAAALLGMILPPFTAILVIAGVFRRFQDTAWVADALLGVRAAVCALVLTAVISLSRKVLTGVFPIVVAAAGFLVLTLLPGVNAVWVIVAGALAGGIHALLLARATGKGVS